ncbi:Uncharacterised protein [uncultured archaeon]|nr:Uncharacterised protein [uncultured archaeon]
MISNIDFSAVATNVVNRGIDAILAVVVVLVFLLLGNIVASVIASVVQAFLKKVKLEETIADYGLEDALAGFTISQIATVILKVYLIFLFLGAAADVINIPFLTRIIYEFINYIPSLVQGLLVVIILLFVASYVGNTIQKEKKIAMAYQLALGIKIFLAYIGLIIALPLLLPGVGDKLAVLERILELFITAIVIAFGLGMGLALGLGLKDTVARVAEKHEDTIDGLFERTDRHPKLKK